ncbi:MAG: hypothetical protein HC830_11620 [Bacteroidetes bacterium]|nr:hypothetical protein [Bacteroidota bacterium]
MFEPDKKAGIEVPKVELKKLVAEIIKLAASSLPIMVRHSSIAPGYAGFPIWNFLLP